jgi:hypothetical protein
MTEISKPKPEGNDRVDPRSARTPEGLAAAHQGGAYAPDAHANEQTLTKVGVPHPNGDLIKSGEAGNKPNFEDANWWEDGTSRGALERFGLASKTIGQLKEREISNPCASDLPVSGMTPERVAKLAENTNVPTGQIEVLARQGVNMKKMPELQTSSDINAKADSVLASYSDPSPAAVEAFMPEVARDTERTRMVLAAIENKLRKHAALNGTMMS